MTDPVYYFGCWGEPGHFWRVPGRQASFDEYAPIDNAFDHLIDGGFAPRRWKSGLVQHRHLVANPVVCYLAEGRTRDERWSIEHDTEEYDQGVFAVHQRNGYTLMSWWDRSQGDTRGACNSNIVALGDHTCDVMFGLLCERFPEAAARLAKAGVVLKEHTLV